MIFGYVVALGVLSWASAEEGKPHYVVGHVKTSRRRFTRNERSKPARKSLE
jgi:hypothetical protein